MHLLRESLFIKQVAILDVIQEHQMVNFKTIKRSFVSTNDRTLRYHLKKLVDNGFIKKRGATKGVYYEAAYLL